VVEVDDDPVVAVLLEHAGKAQAVRRVELDHVAGHVLGAGVRICIERRASQRLHQVGGAVAERLAGRQVEARLLSFLESDQSLFERLRELPGAHLHGRRTGVERTHYFVLVAIQLHGNTIVERHVGTGSDARDGDHGRRF
jgi:hypothetical protein